MVLVPPFHPPIPFSNWKFDHFNTATIHGQSDQALPRQPGNPRPRVGLPLCLFRKTVEGRLVLLGDNGPLIHFERPTFQNHRTTPGRVAFFVFWYWPYGGK
jgi:hypothetical protein